MVVTWRECIGAAIITVFSLSGLITEGVAITTLGWDPLTPLWGQAIGLAFPPVSTVAFGWYLWRYHAHEYRSLLYTCAGGGCLVGATVFLSPILGITTQQTVIGQPVLNAEISLLQSFLGGGLIGLTTGHIYATTRVERLKLKRLHDTTRSLLLASDTAEVAERTVTHAERVLGLDTSGIHTHRDESVLEPIAMTEQTVEILGSVPTIESGESIAWEVYDSGEPAFVDNVRNHANVYNPETRVRSEMIIPIGDFGVFLAASSEVGAFDESDRALAQVLISNAEAAFDRVSYETTIEERERSLESLHDRLDRLIYTQTTEGTAREAINAAEDVTGATLTGVYLLDEAETALTKAAVSEEASGWFDNTPYYRQNQDAASIGALAWEVIATGESVSVDDVHKYTPSASGPSVQCLLVYPVGDHGVFMTAREDPDGFDTIERTLLETLVSALETALNRVEREQTLQQNESRIAQHRQRLTVLNRVLRHDIRNTANLMLGELSKLTEGPDSEPDHAKLEQYVDKIVELSRNARYAEKTVENTEDPVTSVDVTQIIESVTNDIKTTWQSVTVQVDTPTQAYVASNGLLKPAIENIAVNAVEHNDVNSPRINISVSSGPDSDEVLIRIADNGPGISEYEREIFEQREETELRHSSGLGLWLVHWIIDDIDGTVEIEQRRPRGTVVTLRVPRATARDVPDEDQL